MRIWPNDGLILELNNSLRSIKTAEESILVTKAIFKRLSVMLFDHRVNIFFYFVQMRIVGLRFFFFHILPSQKKNPPTHTQALHIKKRHISDRYWSLTRLRSSGNHNTTNRSARLKIAVAWNLSSGPNCVSFWGVTLGSVIVLSW